MRLELYYILYFQLLCEAVRSGCFQVVSHHVRMRYNNPYLPATFDAELEHLAAEATRWDVALELNGFDVLTYPIVVRRLARACALQNNSQEVQPYQRAAERLHWLKTWQRDCITDRIKDDRDGKVYTQVGRINSD